MPDEQDKSAHDENRPEKSGEMRADEKELRVRYGLDSPPPNPLSVAASAGIEFAGIVGILIFLGWWLDRKFETSPWLLLVCALVGMSGGLYRTVRKVLRAGEKG